MEAGKARKKTLLFVATRLMGYAAWLVRPHEPFMRAYPPVPEGERVCEDDLFRGGP